MTSIAEIFHWVTMTAVMLNRSPCDGGRPGAKCPCGGRGTYWPGRRAIAGIGYQVWREPDGVAALAALDRVRWTWSSSPGTRPRGRGTAVPRDPGQSAASGPVHPAARAEDSPGLERATDIGADDYLTVPSGEDALLARIQAGGRQATLRNSEDGCRR